MQALVGGFGVAIAAYHLDEPFRRPEATTSEAKVRPAEGKEQPEAAKSESKAPIWSPR